MKRAIIAAWLATFTIAPLSVAHLSSLHAQTACGQNCGLPGGHPADDRYKPGNGDHGNNGGNGG